MDIRFEKNLEDIIQEFKPSIIGISILNCVRAHDSYKVAKLCREISNAMIVAGGLHATTCAKEVLNEYFEVVVRGEGELTFKELILSNNLKNIKGISYRNKRKYIHNPDRPLIKNLDKLPLPARELRSPKTDYSINLGVMKADIISTSRGCTGNCSFCSPAIYYQGRWRAHSPEYVIEDLLRIEAPWVIVADDHFMGDLDRIDKLCDLIKKEGIKKLFYIQTRLVEGHKKLKKKMVEAGFKFFTFGVEGATQDKLNKYKKSMNIKSIKKYISEWRSAGAMHINGSFVFADPEDSKDDLLEFGDFAREIDLDFADFIFLTPYPNTPLYKKYKEKDMILTYDWKKYTQGTLLIKHPELDDIDMRNIKRFAWLRFLTPKKISRFLSMVSKFLTNEDFKILMKKEEESNVLILIKAIYIGYLNRHLLFGNHYESTSYYHLPRYKGKEISKRKLIKIYLKDYINKFSEEERDITEGLNDLIYALGLKPLIKLALRMSINILFKDRKKLLTTLSIKISKGKIKSAIFGMNKFPALFEFEFDINKIPSFEYESFTLNLLQILSIRVSCKYKGL